MRGVNIYSSYFGCGIAAGYRITLSSPVMFLQLSRKQLMCVSYSYRSASIGFKFDAFRAG